MGQVKTAVLAAIVAGFLAHYFYKLHSFKKLPSPVVTTRSGSLQGIVGKSREGREFYEYLGIPYAKPPVGDLRFESPQPVEKWVGIRDASSPGSICLQANDNRVVEGSEDCLFLNVYAPKIIGNKNKLIPTMVWIHGGFFLFGNSDMYRPDYFMDHDVVLVTVNFRLGPLGFLNTGDSVVRGNMALKDQNMALRWVQANIEYFGGDPMQVTLFGESSGGALVHHHVLSPLSKGLFKKAIAQSGTALSSWASRRDHVEQAERFGELLGCPTGNSELMVKCLKAMDGVKLIEISHRDFLDDIRDPVTIFNPSIEYVNDENAFLPQLPVESLLLGNFSKVPLMIGINTNEAIMVSARLVRESRLAEVGQNFAHHLANLLWVREKITQSCIEILKRMYFGEDGGVDTVDKFQNWTDILTDGGFGLPAQMALELHSKYSPTYAYYYTYEGDFSYADIVFALPGKWRMELEYMYYFVPRWIKKNLFGIEPTRYGASHFDECVLLFPLAGLYEIRRGDVDYDMSKMLVKAWVEFASDPKSDPLEFNGVVWPPVNNKSSTEGGSEPLKYLNIDVKPDLIDEPRSERLNVWREANFLENFYYS